MVIFDPGNKFPHPKRNCFEDKNRSFSGSIQIKYSAMVNTRNKFKRLITKHVLGFFLQSLPNMTLIPVKTKGIKAEEASRYIACGIIDVNTASVYTDLLEKALTRDGVRVSQSFDSVDQRIYSCLDGLSEKENVLLPHQALGKLNWILLLLSFLLVTLFAATIFKGIFKGIFYSNRRTTILRTMLECAFFFLSYLLQNPTKDNLSKRLSWRLLLSAWLIGASFFLNRIYLCNLKGEIATAKFDCINTFEDIIARSDIKSINIAQNLHFDLTTQASPKILELLGRRKSKKAFVDSRSVVSRDSVYLAPNKIFQRLGDRIKTCLEFFQGQKGYFPRNNYLFLSPHLPPSIRLKSQDFVFRVVEHKLTWSMEPRHTYFVSGPNILPKTIQMDYLMSIFYFWICGLGISIAVMLLEIAQYRFSRTRKTDKWKKMNSVLKFTIGQRHIFQ